VPGFAAYWTQETAERAERARDWLESNVEALRDAVL
jgi:hypothetical protein